MERWFVVEEEVDMQHNDLVIAIHGTCEPWAISAAQIGYFSAPLIRLARQSQTAATYRR